MTENQFRECIENATCNYENQPPMYMADDIIRYAKKKGYLEKTKKEQLEIHYQECVAHQQYTEESFNKLYLLIREILREKNIENSKW